MNIHAAPLRLSTSVGGKLIAPVPCVLWRDNFAKCAFLDFFRIKVIEWNARKETPQSNYPKDAAVPINQSKTRDPRGEESRKGRVFGEINTKQVSFSLLAALLLRNIQSRRILPRLPHRRSVITHMVETTRRKILLRIAWSLRHCLDRSTLADASFSVAIFAESPRAGSDSWEAARSRRKTDRERERERERERGKRRTKENGFIMLRDVKPRAGRFLEENRTNEVWTLRNS